MPLLIIVPLDIVAVLILMFGVYYRRHRRPEIVLASISLNLGILAVATVLSSENVGLGLGLGLMGVLSILRLRSAPLSHDEVAYYFSALALGLIAAFPISPLWLTPSLMAAIVLTLYVCGHPRLYKAQKRLTIIFDRASCNEDEIRQDLTARLEGPIVHLHIRRIDLVNDTTLIDVFFGVDMPARRALSKWCQEESANDS